MRVLFMLDGLFMGGAERNTLALMRALRSHGVEPSLCTLTAARDSALVDQLAGVAVRHNLEVGRLYDPRGWLRFLRLLRRERYDCIHIEDPDGAPFGLIARRLMGIPVITTRHVLVDPARGTWGKARAKALAAVAARGADRFVLVAEALRQNFRQQFGVGDDRISVIHNGVAPSPDRRPERLPLRERLGWPADNPVLLMVAVFRPGKGHELLLEALPRILARVQNLTVRFAGDGPERARIERLAEPFGATCSFLGERSDIGDLMAASDILALPSESEALPTVLLEAAMAGLPAVATDVGGVREIIDDGATGRIVPKGDGERLAEAVIELAANPELCRAFGDNAYRLASSEFTVERQAERTLSLYRKVIERHRAKAPQPQTAD